MLEEALARKLIEHVTKYTTYNVNIMNEKGIIIASCDPKRVGSFHEAAYQILHTSENIITVENDLDYQGTLKGINMVIEIDDKREGVVGVTGKPDEIRPVANITKLAIETLLKYETQKLQSIRRQTKKERFIEMITGEQNADPNGLRRLAEELSYKEELIRIPILCYLEDPKYQKVLLESIKQGILHKSEDISFPLEDQYILIFKTIDSKNKRFFAEYKYMLAEYLQPTLQWIKKKEISCKFYIGTFQNNFPQYYYAYRHCKWLENNIKTEHNSIYFYDYISEYIQAIVPIHEMNQIFNVFGNFLPIDIQKHYLELVDTLIDTNFNTAKASEELFMHKNTFAYQYNKLRDMLDVNPQNSAKDKWFLIFLYIYLSRR